CVAGRRRAGPFGPEDRALLPRRLRPREMKEVLTMRALLMAVAVMVAASMVAVGAAADGGGPSPGVSWGWDGVVAPGGTVRYRVRAYDLVAQKLLPGTIVDPREPDEVMAGVPVTRATTADGQWAYTLYARSSKPPFVHALDTMGREAFCIDLPLHLDQQQQM